MARIGFVPSAALPAAMAIAFAMGLGACVSPSIAADENAGLPAWFVEREAKIAAEGKPVLAAIDVQKPDPAVQAQFDKVEAELKAAQAALLADPRAAPAQPVAGASAFDQAARAEIEATRR